MNRLTGTHGTQGFSNDLEVKNLPIPGSGKIPWRWEWQCTPVFLPQTSHGQRRLVDYSPWGRKELGTTEQRAHKELTSLPF